MQDKPRLLIIEDSMPTWQRLKRLMETPPLHWFETTGRIAFHVDVATTAEEARTCLDVARKRGQPYEVVLLDLSLPGTREDVKQGREGQEHGRELLKGITSERDAAVVILTGYPTTENLIHAVKYGATDFVVKPLETREDERMLFVRLVSAVGKTRQAVHRTLRAERLLRLKDHERTGDRERLSRFVSEHTALISDSLHQVAGLLSHRYGLDLTRDAEDPICRGLTTIGRAADEMKQGVWQPAEVDEGSGRFSTTDVSTILTEEIMKVRPSYLYRSIELRDKVSSGLQTRTFAEDLRLMVSDLLLDALELSPEESSVEVSCEPSEDRRDIIVSVERSGERIPKQVQQLLSKGNWTQKKLDPKWTGLCFLQRLANNIGARLGFSNGGQKQAVALRIPVILDE